MGNRNLVHIAVICGLILGASAAAQGAETSDPGAETSDANDYYKPQGARVGGFTLFGEVEVRAGVDDNVLAQSINETDDTFYALFAGLKLASNWSRHELVLNAWNRNYWHSQLSPEDHTDWGVSAEGRADVSYATSIEGRVAYADLTEFRGNTNSPDGAAEPTEYRRFDSYLELHHRFNRLGVEVGGGVTTYDFDDVRASGGGMIDNDDRDRTEHLAHFQADYGVSPDTRVFVRLSLNRREYDLQPPAVPFNRNSEGYRIAGGLSFDLTHLIEGEVYAGSLAQDYEVLGDIDGLLYGASIKWLVTQLTTIRASLDRSVEETNRLGATGYVRTAAVVRARHELRRNIILHATAMYSTNEYEAIVFDEDIWEARLEAEYWMNRNFSASVGYRYFSRESTSPARTHDRSRAWVGLAAHF